MWTDLCGFGDEYFGHFANVASAEGGVLVTKGERAQDMLRGKRLTITRRCEGKHGQCRWAMLGMSVGYGT